MGGFKDADERPLAEEIGTTTGFEVDETGAEEEDEDEEGIEATNCPPMQYQNPLDAKDALPVRITCA